MPLPQRTQLANSRRPQFVRASCNGSTVPAASSSMARASMSQEDMAAHSEQLKAMMEKAKTCSDPAGYMKCVVANYMISKSGASIPASDCSAYCAPASSQQ